MRAQVAIWGLMAVAGLIAARLGLWVLLGAHPWWGVSVALYGLPLLAALALLGTWRRGAGLIATVVILGLAIVAASFGKAAFVASYADNALAGRAWFFGWIGIAGATPALAALAVGALTADRGCRDLPRK